jgi:hypothetical protein
MQLSLFFQAVKHKEAQYFDTTNVAKYNATILSHNAETRRLAQMKKIKKDRDTQKRQNQPWYIEFTSPRGKRWLERAMQDEAFCLGLGAKVRLPAARLPAAPLLSPHHTSSQEKRGRQKRSRSRRDTLAAPHRTQHQTGDGQSASRSATPSCKWPATNGPAMANLAPLPPVAPPSSLSSLLLPCPGPCDG